MLGGDRWQSVALGSSLVGGLSSVALSCTPVWCWTMWAPINFFPCFTRVFTFTCVYNICYLQWFFKIICLIISFFRSPVELVGHIFLITDKYLLCILPCFFCALRSDRFHCSHPVCLLFDCECACDSESCNARSHYMTIVNCFYLDS